MSDIENHDTGEVGSSKTKSAYIDVILSLTAADCERANAVAKVINDKNRLRCHLPPITDRPRSFPYMTTEEKLNEIYSRVLAIEEALTGTSSSPSPVERELPDPFLIATREVSG